MQYLGANTRRVDDNVWVRINELILPNFTQAGSAFAADGTKAKYFGRSSFTRWVVPKDDNHCVAIAWANFGERGDPIEYNNQEGFERIEAGEISNRSREEKQKSPGDVSGRSCFMIDDIVDSAGTLCNAAEALINSGAKEVFIVQIVERNYLTQKQNMRVDQGGLLFMNLCLMYLKLKQITI